jgi:hypothetical protein
MIKVEGYKAFHGDMKVTPKNPQFPPFVIKDKDFLYKPDYDCWYGDGRSFMADTCEPIEYGAVVESFQTFDDIKNTNDAIEALMMCNSLEQVRMTLDRVDRYIYNYDFDRLDGNKLCLNIFFDDEMGDLTTKTIEYDFEVSDEDFDTLLFI